MLENIEHLEAPVLQRLLRRTVLMTLVTGGIAIVISLLVAPPFAAVGIALGLGVAILNLRFLDAGVAKVEGTGEGSGKVIKRMLRTKTATRLAVITVIAIGLLLIDAPLGVGMIVGLVAITPSAGWMNGWGAMLVGLIASSVVWFAWNYLPKIRPFSKVDDALGVVYTHGIAGLLGGLMVGLFADPGMTEYGKGSDFSGGGSFSVGGYFYTGSMHQLWEQFLAAVWIIVYTGIMSTILFMVTKFICRGLRESDEVLEVGDLAIHDEEAFPVETFAERVTSLGR